MKRLRYQDIKGNDLIISAHTGLNKLEFETLAKEFNQIVETYFIHFTIEGKNRRRQYESRKNSVFVEWSDLLLFILIYLKTNPLQIVFATSFGLAQPKSSMWLKLASNFLLETLAKGNILPKRKSERLTKCIENLDKILIDATEREVYRSIDYLTARILLWPKKAHTIKNLIISEPDTYIRYLSTTYEGSIHDKRMAEQEDFNFYQTITLIQDLGFQGFEPENVIIYRPIKKPKILI